MVKEFVENAGVRLGVAIGLIVAACGLGYQHATWQAGIQQQVQTCRQRFVSKAKFRRWIRETREQNRSLVLPDLREDEED